MIYNSQIVANILTRAVMHKPYLNNSTIYYTYNLQEGDTPEMIAHKYYGDADKFWVVMLVNNIIDPFYDFPLTYAHFDAYLEEKYKSAGALMFGPVIDVNQITSGNNYVDGVYIGVPLEVQSGTEGAGATADIIVYNTGVQSATINLGGDEYDTTSVLTANNSYLGGSGSGFHMTVNAPRSGYVYCRTTTHPLHGYLKEVFTRDLISETETTRIYNVDKNTWANTGVLELQNDKVYYRESAITKTIFEYEMELNDSKRTIKLLKPELLNIIESDLKSIMGVT